MKKKSITGLLLKIFSIVLLVFGVILSIVMGVFFKRNVSEMFMTQSYFNWGVTLIGLWVSFATFGILFALGEMISLLTKPKNMQKYYEGIKDRTDSELPNI